jgi:hypothetical protein
MLARLKFLRFSRRFPMVFLLPLGVTGASCQKASPGKGRDHAGRRVATFIVVVFLKRKLMDWYQQSSS